jgi:uncharacterized protein
MIEFEWDPEKARSNERKHGVSFEDAVLVFDDPCIFTQHDRVVDDEIRWQSIGLVNGVLLLLVAHTVDDDEYLVERIRIISARTATRKERMRYEKNGA